MSPNLETWYVIEDVLSNHGEMLVRMVPDHFNSEIAEPVLEVLIKEPTDDLQARYATSRFRTEAVVDVQVSPTAIELWGEYDDAPFSFQARRSLSRALPTRQMICGRSFNPLKHS